MLNNAAADFVFGDSNTFATQNHTLAMDTMIAAGNMANRQRKWFTVNFKYGVWHFTWN